MKKLIIFFIAMITWILSGCAMRVIPYDVDRVDQQLKGNRGVIYGKKEDTQPKERKKTRRVYNVEVEVSSSDLDRGRVEKIIPEGNRGYIQIKDIEEKPSKQSKVKKQDLKTMEFYRPATVMPAPQVVYRPAVPQQGKAQKVSEVPGSVSYYVVEKGDTLQKISKKFYGTTKKWKKIYEANKDILKDPDKIRPGQKLVIPAE